MQYLGSFSRATFSSDKTTAYGFRVDLSSIPTGVAISLYDVYMDLRKHNSDHEKHKAAWNRLQRWFKDTMGNAYSQTADTYFDPIVRALQLLENDDINAILGDNTKSIAERVWDVFYNLKKDPAKLVKDMQDAVYNYNMANPQSEHISLVQDYHINRNGIIAPLVLEYIAHTTEDTDIQEQLFNLIYKDFFTGNDNIEKARNIISYVINYNLLTPILGSKYSYGGGINLSDTSIDHFNNVIKGTGFDTSKTELVQDEMAEVSYKGSNAQVKRSVAITTNVYHRSDIGVTGPSKVVKIAYIPEAKEVMDLMQGTRLSKDSDDGSAYVHPLEIYFLNRTSQAAKEKSSHHKHLGQLYEAKTGAPALFKFAAFELDNRRNHLSAFWDNPEAVASYEYLLERMALPIEEDSMNAWIKAINDVFDRKRRHENFHGYKVYGEETLITKVPTDGSIKNVNDLWKALGGLKVNGNISWEMMYAGIEELANKLALSVSNMDRAKYAGIISDIKNSFISYVSYPSAMKSGRTLENRSRRQLRPESPEANQPFLYTEYVVGVLNSQGNFQHDADNSEIGTPTQFMSAIAQQSDNVEIADAVYRDIADNIAIVADAESMNIGLGESAAKSMREMFVDVYKRGEIQLGRDVAAFLDSDAYQALGVDMPGISSSDLFPNFFSNVVSRVNKSVIRLKVTGGEMTLQPSKDAIKVYRLNVKDKSTGEYKPQILTSQDLRIYFNINSEAELFEASVQDKDIQSFNKATRIPRHSLQLGVGYYILSHDSTQRGRSIIFNTISELKSFLHENLDKNLEVIEDPFGTDLRPAIAYMNYDEVIDDGRMAKKRVSMFFDAHVHDSLVLLDVLAINNIEAINNAIKNELFTIANKNILRIYVDNSFNEDGTLKNDWRNHRENAKRNSRAVREQSFRSDNKLIISEDFQSVKQVKVVPEMIESYEAEIITSNVQASRFGMTMQDSLYSIMSNENKFRNIEYYRVKSIAQKVRYRNTYTLIDAQEDGSISLGNYPFSMERFKKIETDFKVVDGFYVDANGKIIVSDDFELYRFGNRLYALKKDGAVTAEDITKNFRGRDSLYILTPDKYSVLTSNECTVTYSDATQPISEIPVEYVRMLDKDTALRKESFLATLDVVSGRIPARSEQSFMGMRIVAFTGTEEAAAYVNTTHTYFQGSGYKIDTAYTMFKSVNDRGVIASWSPLLPINNMVMTFAVTFPLPNKSISTYFYKQIYEEGAPRISEQTIVAYQDLIKMLEFEYGSGIVNTRFALKKFYGDNVNAPIKLKNITDAVGKILNSVRSDYENDDFIPRLRGDEQLTLAQSMYKQLIEPHFSFLDGNHRKMSEIAKNKIVYGLYRIITSPSSRVSSSVSLDTCDQSHILDHVQLTNVSGYHRDAQAYIGESNSSGKTNIGVLAIAHKAVFAIMHAAHKIANTGESLTTLPRSIQMGLFNLEDNARREGIRFEKFSHMEGLNRDYLDGNPTLLNVVEDFDEVMTNPERWLETLIGSYYNKDNLIDINSMLITASMDNAKNQRLTSFNAVPSTSAFYVFGVALGVDFADMASFMMSPTMRTYTYYMQSSVVRRSEFIGYTMRERVNSFDANLAYSIKDLRSDDARKYSSKGLISYIVNVMSQQIYHRTYAELNQDQRVAVIEAVKKDYEVNIKNAKLLADGVEEMLFLGRILSINRGVSTKDLDMIIEMQRFESLFKRNVEPSLSGWTIDNIKKFSFIKFMSDSKYRESAISAYNSSRHFINPYRIIELNSDFMSMFEQMSNQHNSFYHTFMYSVKYDLMNDIVTKESSRDSRIKPISRRHLPDITHFLDAVMVTHQLDDPNFTLELKGVVEQRFEPLPEVRMDGDKLIEVFPVMDDASYRINSRNGHDFKKFVEDLVLPYARRKVQDAEAAGKSEYDMAFLNHIYVSEFKDRRLNEMRSTLALNGIDMNTFSSTNPLHQKYISSYESVRNMDLSEIINISYRFGNKIVPFNTLGDVLELYTAIVDKGKLGVSSLVPLYDEVYRHFGTREGAVQARMLSHATAACVDSEVNRLGQLNQDLEVLDWKQEFPLIHAFLLNNTTDTLSTEVLAVNKTPQQIRDLIRRSIYTLYENSIFNRKWERTAKGIAKRTSSYIEDYGRAPSYAPLGVSNLYKEDFAKYYINPIGIELTTHYPSRVNRPIQLLI